MKILTASPLPLSRDSWARDITVLYRVMAAMGHETACVRLQSRDGADFPGIIQVDSETIQNPKFWCEQACDLVIANTWGSPKNSAMLLGIQASGAKAVARMDSDGFNSPWNGFLHYGIGTFHILREQSPSLLAAVKALVKTVLYAIPQVYDRKMLAHLSLADAIGIESEGAHRLFSKLLRFYKREDLIEKLHVIRHPVVPEIENMEVPAQEERENCIIAVGRWDSPQKDAPLLIKTLASALGNHPSWSAHIYGKGEQALHELIEKFAGPLKNRIHVLGPRPHEEILHAYQESKICLFTSRYESGPIAGEEALCLGCSLIGPTDVPSMQDLCAPHFGTLPQSRKPNAMADAVRTEINRWESGKRNPQAIATKAREMFSAKAVCAKILSVFNFPKN